MNAWKSRRGLELGRPSGTYVINTYFIDAFIDAYFMPRSVSTFGFVSCTASRL